MINVEKLKLDIIEKLKPLDPYRIILFGRQKIVILTYMW